MIAWAIVDFDRHVWIENKQADVDRNYCALKCTFGHISIYKVGAAEIFKNIGDEYDNLFDQYRYLCKLRSLETGTVTVGNRAQDIE